MQHLHDMPQFLLTILFTQLSPALLHGPTKISIPIENLGTNITSWMVSCGSKADYESKVVLFQSRFLSSPLKICKPSYFWNCSVTCPKYGLMLAEKRCLYIGGKKGQITKPQNTTKTVVHFTGILLRIIKQYPLFSDFCNFFALSSLRKRNEKYV